MNIVPLNELVCDSFTRTLVIYFSSRLFIFWKMILPVCIVCFWYNQKRKFIIVVINPEEGGQVVPFHRSMCSLHAADKEDGHWLWRVVADVLSEGRRRSPRGDPPAWWVDWG